MKKFNQNDEIYFVYDEENLDLLEGWIVSEFDKTKNDIIYLITTKKDIVDKVNEYESIKQFISEYNDSLVRKRSSFIFHKNKKIYKKYYRFIKFLRNEFISKRIDSFEEWALFTKGRNNRFILIVRIFAKRIWKIISFVLIVPIWGTIQLVFGDIITFYRNVYKIYKIKPEIKSLTIQNEILKALDNELGNKVKESNELQHTKKKLENYKKEIKETSRSFIAIIIAVISLLFSILK